MNNNNLLLFNVIRKKQYKINLIYLINQKENYLKNKLVNLYTTMKINNLLLYYQIIYKILNQF